MAFPCRIPKDYFNAGSIGQVPSEPDVTNSATSEAPVRSTPSLQGSADGETRPLLMTERERGREGEREKASGQRRLSFQKANVEHM